MLALALLAFAASPASAVPLPQEIRAEYEVTNLGVRIGRITESFVRKGDAYRIESVTRAEGPLKVFLDDQVTLESSGKVDAQGLRPLHFEQRRARNPKRDVEATFDWQRGVMVSNFQGERREVALPPNTQDRISLMYQLTQAKPGAATMTVPMSNGRRVEMYTYRFVGREKITLPAGEFETLHFERVTANERESRAEVWLARERNNFPVRVVFDDPRGLRLEQSLVAFQAK